MLLTVLRLLLLLATPWLPLIMLIIVVVAVLGIVIMLFWVHWLSGVMMMSCTSTAFTVDGSGVCTVLILVCAASVATTDALDVVDRPHFLL